MTPSSTTETRSRLPEEQAHSAAAGGAGSQPTSKPAAESPKPDAAERDKAPRDACHTGHEPGQDAGQSNSNVMTSNRMSPRQPTTVRLTGKAATALIGLGIKHPGISRSTLVEMSLLETASQGDRTLITENEHKLARFIYRYLLELAKAHTTGAQSNVPKARQIALAAKTTALLIKKVFLEAKGRIAITEK